MSYVNDFVAESNLNGTRSRYVHIFQALLQKQRITMKKNMSIERDRRADDDPRKRGANRRPDETDQGPILVAIALLIFIALIIGLFVTSVYGDDNPPAETPAPVVNQENDPYKNWKPPATPEIVIESPISPEQSKQIAEKWGVEIISLSLTAANYMIDFRFKVLDVEKSKIFFDQRVKPYLLVERSHAKLPVPMAAKVGAFRATNRGKNIKPNKKYYMVFGNPDAHVKSGDKVTMVIGDFKAEHMAVR
ncbi:MAG: hypothetical protein PVG22_18810 [Chromatiales bacterium]|jgi:hypothetical protein